MPGELHDPTTLPSLKNLGTHNMRLAGPEESSGKEKIFLLLVVFEPRTAQPVAVLSYVCTMYVCMYVCMYVLCMYVCMYVCTYVYMYVCIYVCMHVYMYVCIFVCMYACMYVGT